MDYTITVTDTQKKSLEYISPDVDEWITNAATNRARQAKNEIIDKLIKHCNANSIDIATGEAAQVDQAYTLGVVTKAVKAGDP